MLKSTSSSSAKNSISHSIWRLQKRILTTVIVVTLLLTTLGAQTTRPVRPRFIIEDLGSFGLGSRAYSINNSGQVAGSSFAPNAFSHAFRYTDGVGLVDLNQFTRSAITYGGGINDLGQVGGSVDVSGGAGGYHPFRYTDGVGLVDLGTLPGYTLGYGGAINADGQVVGSAYGASANPNMLRAFRYSDDDGMEDLGTLGRSSTSEGINNSGIVVGSSETPTTPMGDHWNPGHAFLYTDCKGMQDLNELIDSSAGWELRRASGINSSRQIVGFGAHNGVGVRAFRFKRGVVQDLGTFPGGGISYALGINNRGEVVGAAYLDASGVGNFRAMLYTDRLGIQNLNDLISPAAGWVLREANGINNQGQIVGWGEFNGQEHAFRLTPRRL
jgi:probable HAF family extracellular repeat protein